ncbi:hypothetical protein ADIARSV_1244 [Arcticibacter svalbardensis MN12-7]|uniref:Uncharacterized protein n=1 Tax=Arcticibacter svalbardensis MN12-7 TaxID=1150600 RepID=R9GV09_9SPHI|nr:hypothetical protein ADIARSV_1244 [Arcticibacter svalbardensis MN12-7]
MIFIINFESPVSVNGKINNGSYSSTNKYRKGIMKPDDFSKKNHSQVISYASCKGGELSPNKNL